jgi:hypothetical protein
LPCTKSDPIYRNEESCYQHSNKGNNIVIKFLITTLTFGSMLRLTVTHMSVAGMIISGASQPAPPVLDGTVEVEPEEVLDKALACHWDRGSRPSEDRSKLA